MLPCVDGSNAEAEARVEKFSDARQIVVSSGTSLLSLCIWDMCGNKHLEHVLVYCGFFEETEALSSKLKASCKQFVISLKLINGQETHNNFWIYPQLIDNNVP